MSYRCEVCRGAVPPGFPLRRHTLLRPDGSVSQEIPVCSSCARQLDDGATVSSLVGEVPRLPAGLAIPRQGRIAIGGAGARRGRRPGELPE